MAYEELCMYCFEDREGHAICPHCGRDSRVTVPQVQMLPGTLIYHDRFLIGRALGQDATGIVYAAFDTRKENRLRIREYMPRDCAERLPDGSVVPIAGMEDKFDRGMEKLRASVEDVEDPRQRHFYFEEYGTAYIAQRKNAQAAPQPQSVEEEGSGLKQIGLIVGIAAAVVLVAVIVIIVLVNGALDTADDRLLTPTLDPTASAMATQYVWEPVATPTATPYVAPTFQALVDPDQSWMDYTYNGNVDNEYTDRVNQSGAIVTARPTQAPTIRPQTTQSSNVIGGNSSASEVRPLQQRLAQLGWLSSGSITGSYDSATRQAVRDFQTYVNEVIRPSERLTVDGIAGPKTQQWLYGTDSYRPTPTPTAAVTPDPQQALTIDRNSSRADIRAVQRKLITLGLLQEGQDDGSFGSATTNAVMQFQIRVNQLQGYTALPVTGTVDPDTMAYLNYYAEQWAQMQQATATPPQAATPTPAPMITAVPEQNTPIPDEPENNTTVDRTSPKESVAYLQQQLIAVGLLGAGSDDGIFGSNTANAIVRFQEWVNTQYGAGTLPVTGQADARTLGYLETAYATGQNAAATQAPEPIATQEPIATEAPQETDAPDAPEDNVAVDANSPRESIQYVQQQLIALGLLSAGSDDGILGRGTRGAVQSFQQYVNALRGAGTLNEDGVLDARTLSYMEEAVASGVRIGDAPTAAPELTAEPVRRVELDLTLSGTTQVNGVYVAEGDTIRFNWAASDVVSGYYVYIEDSSGSIVWNEEATSRTEGQFSRSEMDAREIYTIEIGALPVGGTAEDMAWIERRFAFSTSALQSGEPATDAPQPTAEATQAPQPLTGVTLSINGSSASLVQIEGDSARISWEGQGAAASYSVTITDSAGQRLIDYPETTQTSGTVRRSMMTPGEVYTITVGAVPANEGSVVWTEAQFMLPAEEQSGGSNGGNSGGDTSAGGDEAPATTQAPNEPVTAPVISIDGTSRNEDGVRYLTGTTAIFSWMSTGDIQEYRVYMVDENGTHTATNQTIATSQTVDLSGFAPGSYRIYVGAVPVGATSDDDIVWASSAFSIAANGAEAYAETEGNITVQP